MEFGLNVTENGDLEIVLHADYQNDESYAELQELSETKTDMDILYVMTECYWTNGSYQPFDAGQGNPFVGLTDAPCIAESMDYADDGQATIQGNFWYYGDYMITSFIEVLIRDKRVVFTLCRQD